MKKTLKILVAAGLLAGAVNTLQAVSFEKIPETVTLFKNVQVFDGKENTLHDVDVLVVKNRIHKKLQMTSNICHRISVIFCMMCCECMSPFLKELLASGRMLRSN